MEEVSTAIRPALETLRELDEGYFMDKLAVQIHDAVSAVTALGKPAKVTVVLEFGSLSRPGMTEPIIVAEAEIVTKLPKPDAHKTMFFVDGDGNPTMQQQRQRGLEFSVADSKGAAA